MYRQNPMKEKLKAGKSVVGCWLQTGSADAAEILSLTGLDFLLLDHEHGQATLPDAVQQLRAMKGVDCASLMRVPSNDIVYIKRALDAGVEGIMVPMVETAAEARAAAAACFYPPRGQRGAAGSTRASAYGFGKEYWDKVDDNILVVVQIESAEAVANLAEIGQVKGIDALFIGPRDLSGSVGRMGAFDHPDVRDILRRAEEGALGTGKWVGTIAATAEEAKSLLARGYKIVVPISDVGLLKTGALGLMKSLGR